MNELPLAREELSFRRTECACACCQLYCRHVPGTLGPSDLARLCPAGHDVFAWAEQHLRALVDRPYPALVPAAREDGHCHWYVGGRCAVHENAPYGCAFFDAHMPPPEVDRRVTATLEAIREDAAAKGPYYRVWLHLRRKGLLGRGGDWAALRAEARKLLRKAERNRRRAQGG
jgi:hypothetical protein